MIIGIMGSETTARPPSEAARIARITRAELALVLLALGLGALLRFSLALRGGLWRDEALFLGIAGLPRVRDVLDFLAFHESHPPLYYLLQRAWMGIAGAGDTAAV